MLVIGQTGANGTSFYAVMDTAGYSTYAKYDYSTIHFYPSHDLLSGEWAAAIYYDGIDTDPIDSADPSKGYKAMWLTQDFESPAWGTNSQFSTYINDESWHDNSNPAPGPNTGRSVVRNGMVEIEINYEVVDLGGSEANRSPMTFRDPRTGQIRFMNSDRYCFLQTYTVKNISPGGEPLTNVAFYQVLHSHTAAEMNGVVSSTYTTMNAADPLEQYTPHNGVHQAGNFRYDITQWNDHDDPAHAPEVAHTDFVGFSSEREPDWVDTGEYRGEEAKPTTGTHIRIENRSLNGSTSVYYDRVAGAMGWNLGTLDPNQTTSITVAMMWGPEREMPNALTLSKTDDIGTGQCVEPGNEITYTIGWTNPNSTAATDGVLIDFLPKGVSYPQAGWTLDPNGVMVPPDTAYDAATHSYRWEIGTIAANGSGNRTLTVTVNEHAEPGMAMTNRAWLSTGNLGGAEATHDTAICCWDTGGVIFVDAAATGNDNGTSWTDAYTDLQRALARARETTCTGVDEIRIAHGTYRPGLGTSDTFAIPDGVSVYGGYRGGPADPDDRRPKEFVTILSGRIDEFRRSETVLTMGNNSLLDGVIVRDASDAGQGILAEGITYTLSNCVVEDNQQYGIRGISCNATVRWCTIKGNQYHGIFQNGTGNTITIENCQIQDNQQHGIYVADSISTFKNNIVSRNGLTANDYYGIRITNPAAIPLLHNNTIAYNRKAGIAYTDSDPNYVHAPDIQNCILWYNNQTGNGSQFAGYRPPTHYSCVYDPNDPAGTSTTLDANYNFSHQPDFAYSNEPTNVHLAANSFCINRGNPNLTYIDQLDIDSEDRVMGTFVDVGADEVNPECDEVYHPLDWNADGVVNLAEFTEFSHAWLTCDPNRPGGTSGYDPNDLLRWNPKCDPDQDYDVDLDDLLVFVEDTPQNWLWVACWRLELQPEELQQMMMSVAYEGGLQTQSLSASSASFEVATALPEKSIQEQIVDLEDTVQFLEKLWLDDPSIQDEIDPAEWQQFMDKVYDSFNELKTMNIKTLDVSEESQ